MEKKIETFLAYNDLEIREMCYKPETFEEFALCAMHTFFPIAEKHNSEKPEPFDLIPLGFYKNHTYFDVIYFPRAIEWKFIFDDGDDKAKEFEDDLAIIVWYIGKSFAKENKNNDSPESYSDNFSRVKKYLNNDFVYLPDSQINWMSHQDLFLEAFERIYDDFHFEEGFEQTKKIALKYAINPKFSRQMLNNLKYALNMVDEEQILEFIFKENKNSIIDALNNLKQKEEYFLKVVFDLLNHENINDWLEEDNITSEFYSMMTKYKTPEDIVEIMKVCPVFCNFVDDESGFDSNYELKEILNSDACKSSFIQNLIDYVKKGGEDHKIIYSYLDMINKTHSVQEFLINVSKLTDLETAHFLLTGYNAYFELNSMTEEFDQDKAMAVYLNLYFNFNLDHEVAQMAFGAKNAMLNDLKSKLVTEEGELNINYVSDFLVGLKNEPQTNFIKSLGPRVQQHLKEKFCRVREFSKRIKLAPIIAKMQDE